MRELPRKLSTNDGATGCGHGRGSGAALLLLKLRTYIADDREEVLPVAYLEREGIALETLGLTLAEGKIILKEIQHIMVEKPLAVYVENEQGASRHDTAHSLRQSHREEPASAPMYRQLRLGEDLQSAGGAHQLNRHIRAV